MSFMGAITDTATGAINGFSAVSYVTGLPGQALGTLAGYTVGGIAGTLVEGGKYLVGKARNKSYQAKSIKSYCIKPAKVLSAVGGFLSAAAATLLMPEAFVLSTAIHAALGAINGANDNEPLPLFNYWEGSVYEAPWAHHDNRMDKNQDDWSGWLKLNSPASLATTKELAV